MGKITKTDISFSSNLGSIHYVGLDSIDVFKITALENLTLSFSNNLIQSIFYIVQAKNHN